MRRVALCVALFALPAMLHAQEPVLPIDGPVKMLFVGNSYTQNAGGMNNRIVAIAAADSPAISITADQAIVFSSDVDAFWNSGPGPGMIRANNYDIVVIQGWELAGDINNEANIALFYEYFKKFGDLCDSVGAQVLVFCPWAMVGHRWFNAYQRYEAANDSVGRMLNAPVLHVGRIWWDLRTGRPLSRGVLPSVGGVTLDSLFMFRDDIHPNDSGQYINAMAVYSFITAKSGRSVGPVVSGFTLSEEFQDTIQDRVWKSVNYDAQGWYGTQTALHRRPAASAPPLRALRAREALLRLDGAIVDEAHPGAPRPAPGIYIGTEQKMPLLRQ